MDDRAGVNPYTRKLNAEAWDLGRAARASGAGRSGGDGLHPKALKRAWRRGYDAPTRVEPVEVQHHEAPVERHDVALHKRGAIWPEGKPFPAFYAKRPALPCPKCRRVLTPAGGRAVSTVSAGSHTKAAYLRCKCCRHKWSLPVRVTG